MFLPYHSETNYSPVGGSDGYRVGGTSERLDDSVF